MEETRADESLPWFKQRVRQPPNQLRLFGGYGPQFTSALIGAFLRLLAAHQPQRESKGRNLQKKHDWGIYG